MTSWHFLRTLSWRRLFVKLAHAPAGYRPERYYMRGPGPKYREKQGRYSFDPAAPQSKTE
jgi:hypothetical protein